LLFDNHIIRCVLIASGLHSFSVGLAVTMLRRSFGYAPSG